MVSKLSQPKSTTAPVTLPEAGRVTIQHSGGQFEHAARGGAKLELSEKDLKVARLVVEFLGLRDVLAEQNVSEQTTSLEWGQIEAIEQKLEDIRTNLKG
jgi:hypothetical protein